MEVQSTLAANKALSSPFVRKDAKGERSAEAGADGITQSLSSLKERILAEEPSSSRDKVELSESAKKVALENLNSQESLSGLAEAQDLLGSFGESLENSGRIDSVLQLDPSRVSNLIR